jgi:hypothetical protein
VTISKIPDGLSLNTTYESILEYGGIPVLPWDSASGWAKGKNIEGIS